MLLFVFSLGLPLLAGEFPLSELLLPPLGWWQRDEQLQDVSMLARSRTLLRPVASHARRPLCTGGKVSPMKTGTELYMSLYPEASSDSG